MKPTQRRAFDNVIFAVEQMVGSLHKLRDTFDEVPAPAVNNEDIPLTVTVTPVSLNVDLGVTTKASHGFDPEVAESTKEPVKRTRKPKAEEPAITTADLAAMADVAEALVNKVEELIEEPKVSTAPAVTQAEVKAIAIEFFKAKDKTASLDLLKQFGAKTVADIKEEQFAEFVKHTRELLDAPPPAATDLDDLFGA